MDDPKSAGDQLERSTEQKLEWMQSVKKRFQRMKCKAIEGRIYQKTGDEGRKRYDGGGVWWVSDEREGVSESALVEHQRKPRPTIVSGARFLEKNAAHSACRLF